MAVAQTTDAQDAARAEVEALIHATAEAWNSQDFASVLDLWDPAEPTPFYLAEEQEDWFIGWERLRAYLAPPKPSPAVQGIREEMRDIHVKFPAPGLALVGMVDALRDEDHRPQADRRGSARQRGAAKAPPRAGATSTGPSRP